MNVDCIHHAISGWCRCWEANQQLAFFSSKINTFTACIFGVFHQFSNVDREFNSIEYLSICLIKKEVFGYIAENDPFRDKSGTCTRPLISEGGGVCYPMWTTLVSRFVYVLISMISVWVVKALYKVKQDVNKEAKEKHYVKINATH
jgi:hypothetical protein